MLILSLFICIAGVRALFYLPGTTPVHTLCRELLRSDYHGWHAHGIHNDSIISVVFSNGYGVYQPSRAGVTDTEIDLIHVAADYLLEYTEGVTVITGPELVCVMHVFKQ